ncbi:hypothetical protein CONPUDRAFT_83283 [Coniophora puteana RWD-64-598 SS2]|uniref:Uncharacterized protein n=1 Tax=Coniophora puteana (strain RWD-64-598) TaxID=741705 RepID=A0A5M3MIV6_CONPW|nr:uncharacterized protein CONPUDRAFT_83283 [Coniophora puteana RWD-64-598 SS2]EIW78860.1 hypothetical protein CONPUDRAFT_83283 [Coniophora puteana RWD-64-598 SS2]
MGLYMTYEVILGIFALVYAVQQLPCAATSLWMRPTRSVSILMWILFRDHLIYIFVVLLSMLLTTMYYYAKVQFELKDSILDSITAISEVFQYAVIGPWMIISLRRSYERKTDQRVIDSRQLSEIAFAGVQGAEPSTLQQQRV